MLKYIYIFLSLGGINVQNIIKLSPIFKNYIWGGTKLKEEFNKITNLDKVAESWELACHINGTNLIENTQTSLKQYLLDNPKVLGKNAQKFDNFPILIKLIDAKDNLSIQVHPSNEYAQNHHNSYGKTEFWYVIDCKPDSYLYYGFNKKVSKEEFKERIENNTILEILNKVPIKKGDTFFIESGTVHAICKDTLIAEIQQNSDITYRIYDYNRLDKDGQKRELHIDKAIDVTSFDIPATIQPQVIENTEIYTKTFLTKSDYFEVYKYNIKEKCGLCTDINSFASLLILDGEGKINYSNTFIDFKKGDSFFIPADLGNYEIYGNTEILITQIP